MPGGVTTTDRLNPASKQVEGTLSQSSLPLLAQPLVNLNHLTGPDSRAESPMAGGAASPLPFGSSSAANWLGGLGGKGNADRPGQGPASTEEFHHAINYVNKIKLRYEKDPDTYKQFLDILQTYRKEQTHDDVCGLSALFYEADDIKVQLYAQVYSQVQGLFKDAPDLLAEFKVFLPSGQSGGGHGPRSPPPGEGTWQDDHKRPAKADVGPAPKRKKRVEKEIVPVHPPIAPATKAVTGRVR